MTSNNVNSKYLSMKVCEESANYRVFIEDIGKSFKQWTNLWILQHVHGQVMKRKKKGEIALQYLFMAALSLAQMWPCRVEGKKDSLPHCKVCILKESLHCHLQKQVDSLRTLSLAFLKLQSESPYVSPKIILAPGVISSPHLNQWDYCHCLQWSKDFIPDSLSHCSKHVRCKAGCH